MIPGYAHMAAEQGDHAHRAGPESGRPHSSTEARVKRCRRGTRLKRETLIVTKQPDCQNLTTNDRQGVCKYTFMDREFFEEFAGKMYKTRTGYKTPLESRLKQ